MLDIKNHKTKPHTTSRIKGLQDGFNELKKLVPMMTDFSTERFDKLAGIVMSDSKDFVQYLQEGQEDLVNLEIFATDGLLDLNVETENVFERFWQVIKTATEQ